MCEEEWMFFWMDSNTVSNLRASPMNKWDRQKMVYLLETTRERKKMLEKNNTGVKITLSKTVSVTANTIRQGVKGHGGEGGKDEANRSARNKFEFHSMI